MSNDEFCRTKWWMRLEREEIKFETLPNSVLQRFHMKQKMILRKINKKEKEETYYLCLCNNVGPPLAWMLLFCGPHMMFLCGPHTSTTPYLDTLPPFLRKFSISIACIQTSSAINSLAPKHKTSSTPVHILLPFLFF